MEVVKRILLVQLYSNGDCLYATAVARQIKNDFPGSSLTWAIAGSCKNILRNNPYVDKLWEVNEVPKNDVYAFYKFKAKVRAQQKNGDWDEVFITHNMAGNLAYYDGTIRGMVLRAYPNEITVPVQPVLYLDDSEKQRVKEFAYEHQLNNFKNVILWEFAPQSGQLVLNFEFVMRVSKMLTSIPGTCIILTSAQSFHETETIIDASKLSVRENAELTKYCNLMIGCSSGITWISTSTAGQQLPMLQLLNPNADFINVPSIDFKRNGLPTEKLIEMFNFNEDIIFRCISTIINENFAIAKQKFNQEAEVKFDTTRKLVYNLICYREFEAIKTHYRIMRSVYTNNPLWKKQFWIAFIEFPFRLIANTWRKRIASRF